LTHPFTFDTCENALLVTVFSSNAKPCLMSWQKQSTSGSSSLVDVSPNIIVKAGDDLFQDTMVLLMFRVLNLIWKNSKRSYTHGKPSSVLYSVLPVDATTGYIEAVSNVQSFVDFNWDLTPSSQIDHLICSAVGMFLSGFILGVHDRHKHNMLVQDSRTLLHIDFGFILGVSPALDAPRIAVSSGLKKRLKKENKWTSFLKDCETAYKDLYDEKDMLIELCILLFSSLAKGGKGEEKKAAEKVRDYLAEETFYLSKSQDQAVQHLVYLVQNGPKSYKRWLKNKSHKIATTTASTKNKFSKLV